MNLVELALRIRKMRLDRRMTLEQVASQTGLTRSWLSKVENFRVTPSLSSLGEIAAALGVPVAQLVEGLDEKPQIIVVRQADRKQVDRDGDRSQILYESLAHQRANRTMDPFLLTVQAHDVSREPLSHEGEEFLHVVSGQIDMLFGQETYALATGDSLYFDGSMNHCLLNPYDAAAQVLCVFCARQTHHS